MSKRRVVIYLMCIVALIFFVIFKQKIVTAKRNQEIVSTYSEWERYGKPVVVQVIKRQDIPKYAKITAWQIDPHIFEGNVSKSIRDKLKIGQDMTFIVGEDIFSGEILKIADEISLDSGMYAVEVRFEETFDIKDWLIAYAHIDTFKDSICIPNEIIDSDGSGFYIWKIKGGRAVKQMIKIENRDGYGAIVQNGISEGDSVVFEGFTQLAPGDKVNILKELKV